MKKQVLTLQFGNNSNFIGSHFWGLQTELLARTRHARNTEIDHQVLLRDGDEAYTPRVLLFDKKGDLGSLSSTLGQRVFPSQISSDLAAPSTWSGRTTTIVQDSGEMSTDIPKHWSGFLHNSFHPKSICEVPVLHGASFNDWTSASSIFGDPTLHDDILDQFRFFTEECDLLQGFHVISDFETAFGALTRDILTELRDEYPKLPVITFAASSSPPSDHTTFNTALFFHSLCSQDSSSQLSSFVVPLIPSALKQSFSSTCYSRYLSGADLSQLYHTSAIYAAALDTCTLPYRATFPLADMSDLQTTLRRGVAPQMNILSLSLALPVPLLVPSSSGTDSPSSRLDTLMNAVSPGNLLELTMWDDPTAKNVPAKKRGGIEELELAELAKRRFDAQVRSTVMRGIATAPNLKSLNVDLNSFTDQWASLYRSRFIEPALYQSLMAIPQSYPEIFNPLVDSEGKVGEEEEERTEWVPVMTDLGNTRKIQNYLAGLVRKAEQLTPQKYLASGGIDQDDWKEVKHRLQSLSESYTAAYS